ncbi:hypothetical protein J4442_03510 [Candidatus Woesearchaeota archaeon]|nr:hypothetical protein [Candidatus Woesearchaeota archaeon]
MTERTDSGTEVLAENLLDLSGLTKENKYLEMLLGGEISPEDSEILSLEEGRYHMIFTPKGSKPEFYVNIPGDRVLDKAREAIKRYNRGILDI